jgi:NADH-quinone oxidoreductase subunit L
MACAVLAIIGFPLTSGFFSKDEILWRAYTGGGPVIWAMGVLAALCTAFYMVRLMMLTFYGPNRSDHHTREHLHETPVHMWGPLVLLAIASALVGYLNVPHIIPFPAHGLFEHYLEPVIKIPAAAKEHWEHLEAHYPESQEFLLMAISVLGMLLSSGLAIKLYGNGPSPALEGWKARFGSAYDMLLNKYYVDEMYDAYIVTPLREMSHFMWKVIDTMIIDGVVNGVGQACTLIGGLASFRMSGSLHRHAMVLVLGILCMLTVLIF